jgi:hypothetical protein
MGQTSEMASKTAIGELCAWLGGAAAAIECRASRPYLFSDRLEEITGYGERSPNRGSKDASCGGRFLEAQKFPRTDGLQLSYL